MKSSRLFSCAFVLALLATVATAGETAAQCPSIQGASLSPVFDASLLREGRFTYRLSSDGTVLGNAVIEIRRDGDSYRLSLDASELGQVWQAEVTRSFKPLSAHLSMTGKRDYEMTLRYAGKRVTGTERKGSVMREVKETAPGIVVDQRVDWASMMATTAQPGESIAMKVFDPSTGSSQLLGRIAAAENNLSLHYSICKGDAVEEYTVIATKDTPRMMLREDMPHGLVSELVSME